MSGNILVACCTRGTVRIEHEVAVLYQVFPLARQVNFQVFSGMPSSEIARNWAYKEACDENPEYLMFWDDDILPHSKTAIPQMASIMAQNPTIDVLGGVYPMQRTADPEPIVVKERDGGVWWGWADGKVHDVYMTGTGFTMIRMSALASLHFDEYGEPPMKRVFERHERRTDDEAFAALCAEHGLRWCVAGDVVCDQISLEGHRYKIADARVEA